VLNNCIPYLAKFWFASAIFIAKTPYKTMARLIRALLFFGTSFLIKEMMIAWLIFKSITH
jgi:hypothetical protein